MLKDAEFTTAQIVNPKRHADASGAQEARLYPYYAGYSAAFAGTLFASLELDPSTKVLDPWNGAGVTTHTARRFGLEATGQDLNPAMVVIAKAELLSASETSQLTTTAERLLRSARRVRVPTNLDDPLLQWFTPATARTVRRIEQAITRELPSTFKCVETSQVSRIDSISPICAFYYVVLFRIARELLGKFKASNPTWLKSPSKPHLRKNADWKTVAALFKNQTRALSALVAAHSFNASVDSKHQTIRVGNSEALQFPNQSIDLVFTSPPYCTRIDYAKATEIELSVLGVTSEQFDALRRSLMGTSAIVQKPQAADRAWGKTCIRFLNKLRKHSSKASQTYYLKNHLQYFQSLFASLGEIARVLRPLGKCVTVIQDSYYKDIHNDVPKILTEMARAHGLILSRRAPFSSRKSMAGMHKWAKTYVKQRTTKECVLCFTKQ